MKICIHCFNERPLAMFSAKRGMADGHVNICKPCASAKAKAWYTENKDRARKTNQEWHATYRARSNALKAKATAKRKAAKLQRVPSWYDQAKVQEIYDLAAEFRDAGFKVDVDHIMPLQGKRVSGLHWHGNLRVCLATYNRSKRNKVSRHQDALATPEQQFV